MIGGFLGFSLNMTSWWLSYELHFHNKTCFKFAAQYELENLQLKICCMSRSTLLKYLLNIKLLRANLFQKFAFYDVMAANFGSGNIAKNFIAF